MKVFFILPNVQEGNTAVDAWDSFSDEPAARIIIKFNGPPVDEELLRVTKLSNPKAIFYVGAQAGTGVPRLETFRALRNIAPSINMCHDAFDPSWHKTLLIYKDKECFDLQVTIDGGSETPGIDFGTITPVDPRPYENVVDKDIICGFAGQNSSGGHPRRDSLNPLVSNNLVSHRPRDTRPYKHYAEFLLRCRMIINFSQSGNNVNHVKGRVVEVGLAGGVLLEMSAAPTRKWIPEDYIYFYKDVKEASEIIRGRDFSTWDEKAKNYQRYIKTHYSPEKIYGSMLERLNL